MTITNTATTQVRVVGSNYTAFVYNGQPIAFLEQVQDSGVNALSDNGQGWEFIHQLGDMVPSEVATSRVLDGGVLTLTIRELWAKNVWESLSGLSGTATIVDVFRRLAARPQAVTCQSIITAPDGTKRGKIYHNCVVVRIQDGDNITIGALTVPKQIQVAYTYTSDYASGNSGGAKRATG